MIGPQAPGAGLVARKTMIYRITLVRMHMISLSLAGALQLHLGAFHPFNGEIVKTIVTLSPSVPSPLLAHQWRYPLQD